MASYGRGLILFTALRNLTPRACGYLDASSSVCHLAQIASKDWAFGCFISSVMTSVSILSREVTSPRPICSKYSSGVKVSPDFHIKFSGFGLSSLTDIFEALIGSCYQISSNYASEELNLGGNELYVSIVSMKLSSQRIFSRRKSALYRKRRSKPSVPT